VGSILKGTTNKPLDLLVAWAEDVVRWTSTVLVEKSLYLVPRLKADVRLMVVWKDELLGNGSATGVFLRGIRLWLFVLSSGATRVCPN
jgi:hypothetical protein